MAVAVGTREREGARRGAPGFTAPDDEDIATLLLSGDDDDEDLDDGDDGGVSDELDEDDGDDSPDEDGDEDEDGDGAGASDEGDDEAEEPETGDEEGSSAAAGVDPEVERLAQQMAAKPLSIMQVPANRRRAVITRFAELQFASGQENVKRAAVLAIKQAQADAYEAGKADGRAEIEGDAEYAELEALAADDVEEFGRLAIEEPERVQRFLAKRTEKQNPKGDGGAAVDAAMEELAKRVRGNTAAVQAILSKAEAEPERYTRDAKGLANLTADVAEVLAAQGTSNPKREAAAKRQQAAQERRRLPRPSVGGGGGAGAGTGGLSASWRDDINAGLRDEAKGRR